MHRLGMRTRGLSARERARRHLVETRRKDIILQVPLDDKAEKMTFNGQNSGRLRCFRKGRKMAAKGVGPYDAPDGTYCAKRRRRATAR